MKKESIQGYTQRVTQANRSELIVIIYEIILEDIEDAILAYEGQDTVAFVKSLRHGQKFLNELIVSLDYKYPISMELLQLYLFVNKILLTTTWKKGIGTLLTAKEILGKLRIGFEGVSAQDTSAPLMENTQQVYAGITYGRGCLNEMYYTPNQSSRGFKA